MKLDNVTNSGRIREAIRLNPNATDEKIAAIVQTLRHYKSNDCNSPDYWTFATHTAEAHEIKLFRLYEKRRLAKKCIQTPLPLEALDWI